MENITISNVIYDSFQEYEGESSLVLFLTGCNFKCPYCHNLPFLNENIMGAKEAIDNYLRPNHTAVVFLGGEPTMWESLPKLVKYVKDKGLKTKIFTNGQFPNVLKQCGEYLDAVSIDFKAWSNITKYTGVESSTAAYMFNIFRCIYWMKDNNVIIEVRTTKWPGVDYEEIQHIMKYYQPGITHIIQDYKE